MSITNTHNFIAIINHIKNYHEVIDLNIKLEPVSRERGSVIIHTTYNGKPSALQYRLIDIGALATSVVPKLMQEIEHLRAENERLRDGKNI